MRDNNTPTAFIQLSVQGIYGSHTWDVRGLDILKTDDPVSCPCAHITQAAEALERGVLVHTINNENGTHTFVTGVLVTSLMPRRSGLAGHVH